MTAFFIPVKIHYDCHILFIITGRIKEWTDSAGFCRVIDKSKRNRHLCFHRNIIKPLLPMAYSSTCTFGCYDHHHSRILVKEVSHLFNEVVFFTPCNRNTPKPAEKPSYRKNKGLFFYQY